MNSPHNSNYRNSLPARHLRNDGSLVVYDPGQHSDLGADEIDLRSLWRIIVRYRSLILFIFLVAVGLALVAQYLQKPVYTATGLIEINTGGRNLIKFQNLETENVSSREHISTQAKILSSVALAREVVKRLELKDHPEFNGASKQRSLANGIKALKTLLRPEKTDLTEDQLTRRAINHYRSNLAISPVRGSTLMNMRFDSFDPTLAAKIVNEHMQAYIWLSGERRIDSTSGARQFLEAQISEAQRRLGESEKRLTEFARKNRIVDMEDHNNIVITRLSNLNDSYLAVQNSRIDAETKFIQAKDVEPTQLSFVGEDSLVKSLQEERAKLQARYLELSKIYKPKYPELQELNAKLSELEVAINSQAKNIVAGVENSFLQLQARETQILSELEKAKGDLFDLKDRAVNYNIYKREWEANKELYAGLLERTKEVGVAAGMELNVASVVDSASKPGSPSSPGLVFTLLLAAAGGLLGGVGLAFLLAMLDNTVHDVDQLRKITSLNHLGIVPTINDDLKGLAENEQQQFVETYIHSHPRSVFSESIRSVRASLLKAAPDGFPRSILVTSSVAGEGKSTIAMNLAIACAGSGKRVVVVDADLRRAGYDVAFRVPSSPGLTDFLQDGVPITPYGIQEIANLSVIVSGSDTDNPSEIMGGEEMRQLILRLESEFDTVIIDTPPVLGLADTIMLSTLVQSVLVVVSANNTPQDAIKSTLQRLRMVNAPLTGTVLTNAKPIYADNSQYYCSEPRVRVAHQ